MNRLRFGYVYGQKAARETLNENRKNFEEEAEVFILFFED
jgi:hypothetical protein